MVSRSKSVGCHNYPSRTRHLFSLVLCLSLIVGICGWAPKSLVQAGGAVPRVENSLDGPWFFVSSYVL